MRNRLTSLFSALAFFTLMSCSLSAQHYGFGISKKTVTLQRRLLPDVRLGNVSVMVVFPRGTGGLDANRFSSDLETLIAQSGGGIRLVNKDPEFEIRCYTTDFQAPHITTKTENKVTTREAHGNLSLDARLIRASDGTVAVAFSESVPLNASNFAGGGTFSLPTIHIPGLNRGNAAPAAAPVSDTLAATDTDSSLTSRMMKTLALRVASHMVLMSESITVLLAQNGPLDEADKLALNGRWAEYLEKLSTLPPDPDAANNAYLLYDTGVANEALGYASGDPKTTLKYLRESSINYSRAAEAKPAEKYFVEPQKRIETAITRYAALVDHQGPPPPQRESERSEPAGEKLTNGDIVKLVQAHLDRNLILNKIATAPAVNFDLSVDGLVALSKSGVPSDIIAAMTNRVQQHQTAPARPRR